ncbi:MAG: enoyl-CoA hydratase/isomerase family protein [Acidimicrobiales bacterium]
MTEAALYESDGAVTTITLNRPEQRNVLSHDLLDALGDHLKRAEGDPNCRAIVLTNTGSTFCAGADLKAEPSASPRWDLPGVLTAVLDHPKPVIGRIAGHCMGGGVGLAAACDISVATSDVRFGFTEVRIGVAPAIISVVCLPKLRAADALELFLSGERIGAQRAARVGLINHAVEPADLDEKVRSLVDAMIEASPGALTAAKCLVRRVPGMNRSEAFAWTAELSAQLFSSADAREGMAAFRERRLPSWSPRAPLSGGSGKDVPT